MFHCVPGRAGGVRWFIWQYRNSLPLGYSPRLLLRYFLRMPQNARYKRKRFAYLRP